MLAPPVGEFARRDLIGLFAVVLERAPMGAGSQGVLFDKRFTLPTYTRDGPWAGLSLLPHLQRRAGAGVREACAWAGGSALLGRPFPLFKPIAARQWRS